MVNIVEKASGVCLDDMVHWLKHYQVIELFQCLMTVSLWTKAV
jgi:hypothetical protein